MVELYWYSAKRTNYYQYSSGLHIPYFSVLWPIHDIFMYIIIIIVINIIDTVGLGLSFSAGFYTFPSAARFILTVEQKSYWSYIVVLFDQLFIQA